MTRQPTSRGFGTSLRGQRHERPDGVGRRPYPRPPGPLARCLAALDGQRGVRLEVLVVDDGSRDPADIRRIAASHGVRLLRLEGGGPAAARNAGIRAARGSVVLLTDDDCIPSPDWAAELARAVEETHEIGSGGPSTTAGDHSSPRRRRSSGVPSGSTGSPRPAMSASSASSQWTSRSTSAFGRPAGRTGSGVAGWSPPEGRSSPSRAPSSGTTPSSTSSGTGASTSDTGAAPGSTRSGRRAVREHTDASSVTASAAERLSARSWSSRRSRLRSAMCRDAGTAPRETPDCGRHAASPLRPGIPPGRPQRRRADGADGVGRRRARRTARLVGPGAGRGRR